MRLSQLARQVSKSSRELIHFLESHEIRSYQSSNAKLEPDHVKLVLDHFTGHSISHPDQSEMDPGLNPKKEPETPAIERKKTGEPSKIETETQEPEVIRAPKMKLQGVKVVGKIELPEKPAKTSDHKDPDKKSGKHPGMKKDAEENTRTHFSKKKKITGKTRINRSLSYLEKQKKEERKREKEKRERLKKEKERKRNHYQNKVQTKISPGQPKKKHPSKSSRNLIKNRPEPTPVYKNPLRRLWAWLNGAYDEEI